MKTNRRESLVAAGVHAYLKTRTDVFFWRANTGAGIAPSGQFMRSGLKGQGDFLGLQAPEGRFIGIECKRERGGKLSRDQERFLENVRRHGGIAIVARSVDDVAIALGVVRAYVQKALPEMVIPR